MLCECGQYEATIHEVIVTSDKKKIERHLCEKCAKKLGISSDPYIPISDLISSNSYIMGQLAEMEAELASDPKDSTSTPQNSTESNLDPAHPDSIHHDHSVPHGIGIDVSIHKVSVTLNSTSESTPTEPNTETSTEHIHTDSNGEDVSNAPRTLPRPSAHTCIGCGMSFRQFKDSGLLGCSACYQSFEARIGPMIERAHEGGCSHVGKVPHRALTESSTTQDRNRIEAILGDAHQREERLNSLRKQLHKSIQCEDFEQAAILRDELTRLTTLASSQIEATPMGMMSDTLNDSESTV